MKAPSSTAEAFVSAFNEPKCFNRRAASVPFPTSKAIEELIQDLRVNSNDLYSGTGTLIGVVLCGDFNADANTPNTAIATILKGGFTEAWPTLHPLDPGFTDDPRIHGVECYSP